MNPEGKELYTELEQFGGLAPLLPCRQRIADVLADRMTMLRAAMRPANPRMVASIVTTAASQLIGEAAVSNPEWLEDSGYEEQICQLILGYDQRLGLTDGC